MPLAFLSSTATNAEASQIIGTINGVIQQINNLTLIGSSAQTSLRNAVIGGNFETNPWQRGTTFTGIVATLTYTADRFWARGGASGSISVSRQSTTPPPGFANVARFGRAAANTDTTAQIFGQVFTSSNSTRFQGQPFVLSFWARAGATYSAASNALTVIVGSGTGSDESATLFSSASWTGYASAQLYGSAGTATSTVTLTTAFQRFAVSGVIPTATTQVGLSLSYTPVGTAGATDYFEVTGIQFEQMTQGGVTPTPFEARPASMELALCQHYYYRCSETGTGAKMFQGQVNSTTVASINFPFPVPMRVVTTLSSPDTTVTIGGFGCTAVGGAVTGSLATAGGLAVAQNSGTTRSVILTATQSIAAAFTAAGDTTFLISGAGAGTISVTAEL